VKSSSTLRQALICAPLELIAVFACTQTFAQSFVEISRFETIHGEVVHLEDTTGQSKLRFVTKGNLVALPSTWGRVSIEQVVDLNGQTAVLMSHTEANCPSRLALAVVSRNTFWGPYAVGGCEDILVHQRSEDGLDLLTVRADTAGSLAWVYSAADSRFRGPVAVDLPASMAMIVPKAPIAAPAQKVTPTKAPTVAPAQKVTPTKAPTVASAQKVTPTQTVATPPLAVPTESSLRAGETLVSPRRAAAPAAASARLGAMTPQEVSVVSQQARKAPAAKVLSIDL
jgi:hypothetical protein